MAQNIISALDRAKVIHRLPSDYKLALVMGISHSALVSYRAGKTLPDARVISLICDLTGDDPALMAAQVEADRSKTAEARKLWLEVVSRLQSTLHAAIFSVLIVGALFGGFPSGAQAAQAPAGKVTNLYIVECVRQIFTVGARFGLTLVAYIRALFQGLHHVPRPPSIAAA